MAMKRDGTTGLTMILMCCYAMSIAAYYILRGIAEPNASTPHYARMGGWKAISLVAPICFFAIAVFLPLRRKDIILSAAVIFVISVANYVVCGIMGVLYA